MRKMDYSLIQNNFNLKFSNKKSLQINNIDVTKDAAASKDIVRRTGQQGVPVVLINNRPVIGFDKAKLDRLLEIRG